MWTLLVGRESFLKREFIQTLHSRLFSKESGFGNFQEFTAKKDSLNGVLDFLLTAPFLSEKRLAVLWAVDDLAKEDQSLLLSFLEKKISTADLVLTTEQASVKKSSFLTALAGKCQSVACHTPFDRDLPRWVQARAKRRDKQIEKQAIELLIERVGKDLASLDLAIEQLTIFCATRPNVALGDVEQLLGKSVQADVFKLLDLVMDGEVHLAIELLLALMKEGSKTYEIMGALVGQLDRLRKAVQMLEKNHSGQEISAELKIHPFYLEKFLGQARRLTSEKIDFWLHELLRCDELIKNGSLNDQRAMERFILEVG